MLFCLSACVNEQNLTLDSKLQPDISLNSIQEEIHNQDYNSPLMLICIDGYGFNMYEFAIANHIETFLTNNDIKPLLSVYPPKTINALNLVGKGKKDKLFEGIKAKSGIILTEKKVFYTSKYEIKLHSTDEETFQKALIEMENSYSFIFIHFKNIDYTAHEFGHLANETMQAIQQVSTYIETLMIYNKYKIIIFSDHGFHSENGKGIHGENIEDDMIGIYWSNNEK
jgi:hypothetical protein